MHSALRHGAGWRGVPRALPLMQKRAPRTHYVIAFLGRSLAPTADVAVFFCCGRVSLVLPVRNGIPSRRGTIWMYPFTRAPGRAQARRWLGLRRARST
eukprot:5118962-Pleurochrysis_carterae.AAC.1